MIRARQTLVLAVSIATLFGVENARAKESISTSTSLLYFSPEGGYTASRVFVQGRSGSYAGPHFGGSVYYRVGDEGFSWAPFVGYRRGKYDNASNTATQTETFSESTISFGLKFYFGNFFLKGAYSRTAATTESRGVTNHEVSDANWGIGGGVGYALRLGSHVSLELGADLSNTVYSAKPNGFTTETQFLRYGGTLGISILLPSTPPRPSYFTPSL